MLIVTHIYLTHIQVRVSDYGSIPLTKADYLSFYDAPTQKKRHEVGGRGLGLFCLGKVLIYIVY